ncbi:2-amino-4-hydroxy-6-hydroxymethyldihydropteridine diphosphokinase [Pseudidiomarina gelatinasegens]|uniref:2-amino-4-hydroxy-6- hydroxymethyldihydropteridine diphosphokinase n=1 Tax=Pseudidiomarina gelatinasegens TaxID=2487740 RepID=UPI0030EEBDDB|tara:strand:- start:2786 stop:3265 length:480 start_codon:yes stop_codon:yes gene_type:complete
MATVYIGLGANLGNPEQTLKEAIFELSGLSQFARLRASSLYASKPMGPAEQPDYVNAVVCAETDLAPLAVLDLLQAIEHQFGRQRSLRWGPRTLDLDLLLYGNETISLPRLTIPHPGLTERDFVVVPLAELNSELVLPDGRSLLSVQATMAHHDLQKIT